MAMALEGIRVVDFSIGQLGPAATMMLADMGADVIKLEEPVSGDPGRYLHSIMGVNVALNFYFENNNRNKRSVTVDLKTRAGKDIVYRLVEKADVFATNYRRSALARLGMEYQTLSGHNPKLIYAVGCGFGKKGADSDKPALDLAAQARGGIMSIVGEPGQPPSPVGVGLADQIGAGLLAYGIMLALFARERTGRGQEVDVSLLGGQAWLGSLALQEYLFYGKELGPLGKVSRREVRNPLWNTYRARDGKWLCLSMLVSEPYWPDFCKAMGLEALENDSRFESHAAREENARELIALLDELFATATRDEWAKRLGRRELIWEPVKDYGEVAADPQMQENEYIVDFDHPVYGPVKEVGLPVQLGQTPGKIRRPAPELGQHTEEVLLEAGYSWEEIARLREEKVI
jgi:crotonobetainyl-CoA:carnitine CoA-transferase CaiB-like acyl-CoA transferase